MTEAEIITELQQTLHKYDWMRNSLEITETRLLAIASNMPPELTTAAKEIQIGINTGRPIARTVMLTTRAVFNAV